MKKNLYVLITSLLCVTLLSGCSNGLYKNVKNGYRTLDSVQGITFEIPDNLLNNAAAITQISPELDFAQDNSYVYKNGESEYFFFNMQSIVIAAQKNTDFNVFNSKDKLEAIKKGNVLGIFFDKTGSKLKYESNKSKMIANVTGGVSVTTEIYADFTGKLAIVTDGNEEWSVFVGLLSDRYPQATKDALEIIENVTKSVKVVGSYENTSEITSSEVNTEFETIANAKGKNETEEQKSTDTTEIESTEELTSEAHVEKTSADIVTVEEASDETAAVVEQTTETSEKVVSEEKTTVEVETVDNQVPDKELKEKTNLNNSSQKTITLKNQKNTDSRNQDNAYLAGIYDMLSVGYLATAPTFKVGSEGVIYPKIRIQEVYEGNEADSIIEKYCEVDNIHNYEKAPAGCQWNVAKYSLDYSDCDQKPYVNIKLKGMDGDTLKFRGIKYTKRTYDIFTSKKENGRVWTDLYCYYAVPNGCKEYSLECGDGSLDIKDGTQFASYYKINILEGN